MLGIIIILFLAAIPLYMLIVRKLSNFPPGPTPLPFLGNLLTIGDEPHVAVEKLSKEYGPIVGVQWGPDKAICLHGTDLIKEGYNNPLFLGRRFREATAFVAGDQNGIVHAVGEKWKEQRRFILRHLRDFGFGKSSMEELIMEEVRNFIHWLKKQNRKPVVLQRRLSLAVVNSLWKILTGDRFDHDDEKLHNILYDLETSAKAVLDCGSGQKLFMFFYPKIGRLFPNWSGWKKLVQASIPRMSMFTRIIQEHESTFQQSAPRDFIDVYLEEIHKTTNPDSSFHPNSGILALKSVMADVFLAGTDTTGVTLSWLILYLLHNPHVQRKMQQELDNVVGGSRTPTLSDRKNLPYTEAVILETMRLSSIAIMSIPHTVTENTTFHGYDIPKGTLVFANLYANHYDPNIWGKDVKEFRAERFLSSDESTVVRHESLIPFSTGPRACPGETLARDTIFLFAANLAQQFDVIGEKDQPKPPLKYKKGQLTLAPISSTVVMVERKG